jgi:hypothetical protein
VADTAPRPTATELIRSIGLTGLVRPATAGSGAAGDTPIAGTTLHGPGETASGGLVAHAGRPTGDATGTEHDAGARHAVHLVPPRREPDPSLATAPARPAPVSPFRGLGTAAAGLNAGDVAGGLGAPDRTLPVLPLLRDLLPGRGLRRGSTVATQGATSLVIALLAAASRAGSWCAVVGLPSLGALAAAEAGVALDRLALVPYPGPDWTTVVAALLDGVDIVVAAPPGPVAGLITDRLAARARQRGSVLVGVGRWPGADVVLDSTRSRWEGLDQGRGRLYRREMTVLVRGRGAASQPREARLWMPALYPVNHAWHGERWSRRDRHSGRPALALVPAPDRVAPDGGVPTLAGPVVADGGVALTERAEEAS